MISNIGKIHQQIKEYPQSAFGAHRKYDIHTGVDVYVQQDPTVRAITEGIVVEVGQFTGKDVGSPWWNDTYYCVIKHKDAFVLYGEIQHMVVVGDIVEHDEIIGEVIPVLKIDKHVNPMSMLHIECYSEGPFAVEWKLDQPQPSNLLDPLPVLETLKRGVSSKGKYLMTGEEVTKSVIKTARKMFGTSHTDKHGMPRRDYWARVAKNVSTYTLESLGEAISKGQIPNIYMYHRDAYEPLLEELNERLIETMLLGDEEDVD